MKFLSAALLAVVLIGLATLPAAHAKKPLKIVVLGDSLTAGYGLPPGSAFPEQLQVQLRKIGFPVQMINAGVSGDTSAGGLARLAWTLAERPDLMIIELGANDALRGLDPDQTKQNLAAILKRLKEEQVQPLLTGMLAPRNLGDEYYSKFDALFAELAAEQQVPLYPFFLAGVAGNLELNQADGIHPTAAGVERIVAGILPLVIEVIQGMREQ